MRIRRGDGPPIRIGHRGAAALAPENTVDAIRAGIAVGCEYVEFDVLSEPDGRLVLAHSAHELPEDVASLDDALDLLGSRDVGAHVDLKERGLEEHVAAALRRHGMLEESLVSSLDWAALVLSAGAIVAALRLGVGLGWLLAIWAALGVACRWLGLV